MVELAERLSGTVSLAELERRWQLAREIMHEARLDALVVQGANNMAGVNGYFQWLSGRVILGSYPEAVIMPREGLMTLITHGPAGTNVELGGKDVSARGIGRRVNTPAFPMVAFTGRFDAEAALSTLEGLKARRVGLVGPNAAYHGFLGPLTKQAGDRMEFVDVTEEVDRVRANKSDEEVAFIRKAAQMQDEILAGVKSYIRPGLRDFEVMAYGEYLGKQRGSQAGYFLGSSAPPGQPANMRLHPQHNRRIEAGDVILVQAENAGPGGYFTHLCRYYALGKPPQEFVDAFGKMVEAQDYTLGLLQQGAKFRDVFRTYNDYMRSRGLPEERRVHCHAQGYDVVERPIAVDAETLSVTGTLNIGIHPVYDTARFAATVCDNFLIRPGAKPERLHRIPREIIQL